jgi:hypothetical protein
MPLMLSKSFAPSLGALLILIPLAAHADELTEPLAALKSVGPQGAGNQAASAAWRRVSAADASQLPRVLAALDQASPLAANWIRSAADAIAERSLANGQDLPQADLEQFLLDTNHNARARRMAFEWLTRVDPGTPDRLIPRMLNDPSVELRRDAIIRLAGEAKRLNDSGQPDQAITAYQQALSAARDLEQVKAMRDELKKLGVEASLTDHFGFLRDWKLIGPFDNVAEVGWDRDYPPEAKLDFAAELPGKAGPVKWVPHSTTDELGVVDLNAALGKQQGVVGYAYAVFESPEARDAEIRWGCVNANKLWLNGKQLAAHHVYHAGEEMDQYAVKCSLQRGRNELLLKVCQNEQKEDWAQDWRFQVRICDSVGTPLRPNDGSARVSETFNR